MELALILVITAGAVGYLGRRFYRQVKAAQSGNGSACDSGCGGCCGCGEASHCSYKEPH